MVDVRRSTVLDAPIDTVWQILRDFNGHESWHPAVTASSIEERDSADSVGAVRCFRLVDGAYVREQLLALSDRETSFAYCILEAPVQLRNYVASVRLRSVTSDDTCLWEWRATFDPPVSEREKLKRFVTQDIIEAGFQAVRALLRGENSVRTREATAAPPVSIAAGLDAVAIVLTRHGGPEALEMQGAWPRPGPGEARIRQTAIGVNFVDVYCRRGSFDLVTPPGVLGMEAAGIVESVGPGVSERRTWLPRWLRLRPARCL